MTDYLVLAAVSDWLVLFGVAFLFGAVGAALIDRLGGDDFGDNDNEITAPEVEGNV